MAYKDLIKIVDMAFYPHFRATHRCNSNFALCDKLLSHMRLSHVIPSNLDPNFRFSQFNRSSWCFLIDKDGNQAKIMLLPFYNRRSLNSQQININPTPDPPQKKKYIKLNKTTQKPLEIHVYINTPVKKSRIFFLIPIIMQKMSLSHFSIFVILKHKSHELKELLFSNEKKVYT